MAKLSQPPTLALRWQADIGDHVIALDWSPKGAELAAASVSGPITIFDSATGAVKHALAGHGFGTTSLSWEPRGNTLASSGQDGKVRLWDTVAGSEIAALDGGAAWVERVCWSPRGDFLASAAGKKLRLWKANGEMIRAFSDQPATLADLAWSAKGNEFVSAGYGGVAFWGLDAEVALRRFDWKGSVLAVAWSPDGKYLACGAQDASVHLWFSKTGKDLEMSGYPQKVRELSWDSSSTYLATGGGNQITIWNCSGKGPAGSKPISFEFHEQPLSSLAFQNRGPLLASACTGGGLTLTLPGGSKKALAQTKLETGIALLAWAPNDSRLAVGGESGLVGMWAV